jgi:amino acid transporter
LPSLGNATAFSAITSVATIGLYISYGVPIAAKLMNKKQFRRGPLHLGRFSDIVGVVAVLWICFITILFVLPPDSPVTPVNMNYACLAIGAVILGAGGRWIIDGHKWFKGPVINLSDAELAHVHLDQDEPPTQANDEEKAQGNGGSMAEKVAEISEQEKLPDQEN